MQIRGIIHVQVHHAPRLVTGIDLEGALRTAQQNSRTDQQNKASGHLAGDEQSAEP